MTEKNKKSPIIIIGIVIGVLMLMIAIGYALGFLSEDPDGLERTLIDAQSEEWVESLPSPWTPILGWIGNDFIIGIVGVVLTAVLIMAVFYIPIHIKNQKIKD